MGKLRPGREDSQKMGPYQAGLAGGAGGRIPLRALGGHAELGLQCAVLVARDGRRGSHQALLEMMLILALKKQ